MKSLTINFCGDFVSFSSCDMRVGDEIKSLLNKGNLNFVNVEAPLCDLGMRPIPKSGPSLCQPPEAASTVKALGFNVVSLANNHIFDYGEDIARSTASAFEGINILGLGTAEDVYRVKIVECEGVRIGFIAACQREFGALDGDNERSYGYAWINDDRIDRAIIEARTHCDVLFVCPHAGVEEVEVPLPEWRKRYRSLIDLGADAVIASHPHIVQGYEDYRGKRIYYSLGNFFFDRPGMKDCWHHGLMVTATVAEGEITYENHFVRLDGSALSIDNEKQAEMSRFNALLSGTEYDLQIDKLIDQMLPFYDDYFAVTNSSPIGQRGLRRMLSWVRRAMKGYRDDIRLINLIRCESHRWLYVRCLNKRSKNIY